MEAFNPLLSIFVDVILAGFDKFRIFYVFTVKMWCNGGSCWIYGMLYREENKIGIIFGE